MRPLDCALVTGASGFIGRRLLTRLIERGCRVVVLTRNPQRRFPPGVTVRIADLATGRGLTEGLGEISHVFHCAGELTQPAEMRPLHVDGTRHLIDSVAAGAGQGSKPVQWVQLSSVGAYGPAPRAGCVRTVSEDSHERPVSEYETTKTESDRLVRQGHNRGLSWSILRPANVVGPEMPNASVRQVAAMVKRRRFVFIGSARAMANYVHVDDVVSALMSCATNPAAQEQVFNLSSDCSWADLIGEIADRLDVARPWLRIPESVVRPLNALVEGRSPWPLSRARIDAFVNQTQYPSTKIAAELGFRFSKPMPGGIGDVISRHD